MKPYYETELGKLYKGDCLEVMQWLISNGIKVDTIITDPPYGTTNCSWDAIIPFEEMWELIGKLAKGYTPTVLFGSEPFSSNLRVSNLNQFKYDWIWEKQKASNFMSAKYNPLKYHENISVFGIGKITYNPQRYKITEIDEIMKMNKKELVRFMTERKYDCFGKVDRRKSVNNNITNKRHIGNDIKRLRNADDGFRNPKSVIKINKSINGNLHPTQKPLELLAYLVKTYSNENDLILDFTSGSGTLAIACEQLGRKWICIEQEEKYCDITIARLKEIQQTLF